MGANLRIVVVGTADTKGEELAFLADVVRDAGGTPVLVDVGSGDPAIPVGATRSDVLASRPDLAGEAGSGDRGRTMVAMADALAAFLPGQGRIDGIVGMGGGGGTSVVAAGMRALPLGVPKLLVSTLASGDTAPYVDISDIVMMPAITDLAGLNRISRGVLERAGRAVVAMAQAGAGPRDQRPAVGLTMFGVTTACVTAVAALLKATRDPLVFHATGAGGRTMEKLLASGMLEGVIDATTTEICDLVVGGVLSAGPTRLDAVAATGLPYVGSAGALDMVNFWAFETVPDRLRARNLYRHNANVTLMRTTPEECDAIGRFIGEKLSRSNGPVRFLIPEKGVSALDREGQPFFDPEADAALFAAIEETIRPSANRRVERLPLHVNDPDFSAALAETYLSLI